VPSRVQIPPPSFFLPIPFSPFFFLLPGSLPVFGQKLLTPKALFFFMPGSKQAKCANVFVVTFPFGHSGKFGLAERKNLFGQYKYLFDSLSKKRDAAVIVFGGFALSNMGKNAIGSGLLGYARQRLGKRLFLDAFSDAKETNKLAGLLSRKREIRVSGCGELASVCSDSANKFVVEELGKMGFRAGYSSQSLAGSVDFANGKGISPLLSKNRFKKLVAKRPRLF